MAWSASLCWHIDAKTNNVQARPVITHRWNKFFRIVEIERRGYSYFSKRSCKLSCSSVTYYFVHESKERRGFSRRKNARSRDGQFGAVVCPGSTRNSVRQSRNLKRPIIPLRRAFFPFDFARLCKCASQSWPIVKTANIMFTFFRVRK